MYGLFRSTISIKIEHILRFILPSNHSAKLQLLWLIAMLRNVKKNHLFYKIRWILLSKEKSMELSVIRVFVRRWCKRSVMVNVPFSRPVLIPRARCLSIHQSQPCVCKGEPTCINLEPPVKIPLCYPQGHKSMRQDNPRLDPVAHANKWRLKIEASLDHIVGGKCIVCFQTPPPPTKT